MFRYKHANVTRIFSMYSHFCFQRNNDFTNMPLPLDIFKNEEKFRISQSINFIKYACGAVVVANNKILYTT